MATQEPLQLVGGDGGSTTAYKRASRKNAPRRFTCDYPACGKIYSRAEHLQRHQLNHEPKEIFRCDVAGCGQKFVRADLLSRHKKRHSASYIPRNRVPSFSSPKESASPAPAPGSAVVSPTGGVQRPAGSYAHPVGSVPHDAAILLTPDPSTAQPTPTPRMAHASAWPGSIDDMAACNIIRPKPGFYARDHAPAMPEQPAVLPFGGVQFSTEEMLSRGDNFAVWLFDPQASYNDFSVANLPFLEGGLESPFNSNIHYDYESLTSGRSQLETPPRQTDGDELITEFRRQEVLHWFQAFRPKNPRAEPIIANLVHDSGGDMPGLNLEMMRFCLQEYWEHVSPRLPIVHQPLFSCNRCPILLLLVMIALGAASLRSRDASGKLAEYGSDYLGFADVLICSVRWEILTADEASPPVGLWVAQALLLLEFYEKMYSARRLHERAHIYHSATLTLLRRGSPLIGRAGSESPPEEQAGSAEQPHNTVALDSRTWWIRWAETEAMHRVVFAAFMMDVVHAAMFGHAADMAPYEIRLPLPCDDNFWTASSPDVVRQLDANLRMYGVKPISFLDGLKRALHGKEVKTHSFGRMVIMCGLLSVGWHLSHRETHLKWLDLSTPSTETQDGWKRVLLRAFDGWKESFDSAQGSLGSPTAADPTGQRAGSNGPIQSASALYHLAHISLHVDIVDCQVYAGAKRLLGRKVSTRDYGNVVSRMKAWAVLASTRHAILHAFRLLHRVLVDPRRASGAERDRSKPRTSMAANAMNSTAAAAAAASGINLPHTEIQTYSCRSEPDPHRPWIMYYAALSIWSYVRALGSGTHSNGHGGGRGAMHGPQSPVGVAGAGAAGAGMKSRPPGGSGSKSAAAASYRRVVAYLSSVAELPELAEHHVGLLAEGLPDLLVALAGILAEAQSELLREAHERLLVCREILINSG